MSRAQPSPPRRLVALLALWIIAAAVFALAVALLITGLVGVALLAAGLASWLHPADVAAAWARTLGGIGLIGGSAGLTALGSLAIERLAGPLARLGRQRPGAPRAAAEGEAGPGRARKFVAVVGILMALICLPFAAAIHASARAPWLGWGESRAGGA